MLALQAEVSPGSGRGSQRPRGRGSLMAAWWPPTAAPHGARRKQHCGNGSKGWDSPPGGFQPAMFCTICKSISWCTFLQASGDRMPWPQHSLLPSRALLSIMLPKGGRTGAPHVSSNAEIAATHSYYGKSLHSCAKQSLCPTSSRISHDLLPNTATASAGL